VVTRFAARIKQRRHCVGAVLQPYDGAPSVHRNVQAALRVRNIPWTRLPPAVTGGCCMEDSSRTLKAPASAAPAGRGGMPPGALP